jgi:hypothetical protein
MDRIKQVAEVCVRAGRNEDAHIFVTGSIQLGGVIVILLTRCIQWCGAQASLFVLFSDGADRTRRRRWFKSPANEDGAI